MRKRKVALALPFALAAALLLALGVSTGSARTQKHAAAFKAAWIYVGPHNDGGWSQAHDKGRLYVQSKLGSSVETTFKENVPEGPQVAQVIESLIRDGNKIIFATSFGFQPSMVSEAKKHPDVKFEMATGTAQSSNMAEYFGAGEDAIYLSGMAAGAATKKGIIGYVVPFAIPEVIRHANAFALGAQATHPGVKVKLIWTNSWFDPGKETKAAQSLHAGGADVLGQNVDSPAAGQYAEKKGAAVGRLRLRRAQVRSEAVVDGGGLQLGPVLPAEDEGRDERDLEDELLLRQLQGQAGRSRAVRAEGDRQDEGGDREKEGGLDQGQVLRVRRSAVRPEGQAADPEGQAHVREGSLRHDLARQGRHR